MFSYPADIFPLVLLFPLLLGLTRGKVVLEKTLPRYGMPMVCLGLLFTSATGVLVGWRTLREQSEVIANIVRKDCREHLDCYVHDNYNALKYNGVFSNHYIPWVRANKNTHNPHIETTAFPSCETYCDLGDYFHDKGEVWKAETYYKIASYMILTRLTPKYKLWKLYLKSKQDEKAEKTARRILDNPLKVETVFTIRAKAEVKTYLETQR